MCLGTWSNTQLKSCSSDVPDVESVKHHNTVVLRRGRVQPSLGPPEHSYSPSRPFLSAAHTLNSERSSTRGRTLQVKSSRCHLTDSYRILFKQTSSWANTFLGLGSSCELMLRTGGQRTSIVSRRLVANTLRSVNVLHSRMGSGTAFVSRIR